MREIYDRMDVQYEVWSKANFEDVLHRLLMRVYCHYPRMPIYILYFETNTDTHSTNISYLFRV